MKFIVYFGFVLISSIVIIIAIIIYYMMFSGSHFHISEARDGWYGSSGFGDYGKSYYSGDFGNGW